MGLKLSFTLQCKEQVGKGDPGLKRTSDVFEGGSLEVLELFHKANISPGLALLDTSMQGLNEGTKITFQKRRGGAGG